MRFFRSLASRYAAPPVALFDCPVARHVSSGSEPIAETIQQEARNRDWVIIATDNDREGENIGFEIIELCRAGPLCPSLLPSHAITVCHSKSEDHHKAAQVLCRHKHVGHLASLECKADGYWRCREIFRAFANLEEPSRRTSDVRPLKATLL